MHRKVYIVAARRTPIGKFMGSLSGFSPGELGSIVIRQLLEDTKVDPAAIDEVIGGNVLSAGQMQGVIRQASIKGGVPVEVPAYGINMICGSGMRAVMNGVNDIAAGDADIVIAGGTEVMSNAGFVLPGMLRSGNRMGTMNAVDHMVCDGLTDAFNEYHMGITAENVAQRYGISKEEQDAFSYASQQKAIAAVDEGRFDAEIVPVEIKSKKETLIFCKDEFPNRTTSLDKMAALKPVFKKDGTVTAGNASGVNDGASFVMLMSEDKMQELGLTPMAEVIAIAQGGVDPAYMGLGPVPAIRKALQRADKRLDEMDFVELNEAFAAQSLGVISELKGEHKVSEEWIKLHVNPNGGAIALGHPIGSSGNRILVTLIHELIAHRKQWGLASLCIGGGMGTAIVIRNCRNN